MSEAKTLLGYVPDLLQALEDIRAEEDAARAEVKQIDEKIHETELALYRRREETRKPDRSRVLAEAALRGEPPPPEPEEPPGPAPAEIEATIRGLQAMRAGPLERIGLARDRLKAQTVLAFREGAERAAVDLLAAAQKVATLHAAIGAAHMVQVAAAPDKPEAVLVGRDWWELWIPTTEQLEALECTIHPHRQRQFLAGGDLQTLHLAASAAFDAARAEVSRRLGRWPLDRS